MNLGHGKHSGSWTTQHDDVSDSLITVGLSLSFRSRDHRTSGPLSTPYNLTSTNAHANPEPTLTDQMRLVIPAQHDVAAAFDQFVQRAGRPRTTCSRGQPAALLHPDLLLAAAWTPARRRLVHTTLLWCKYAALRLIGQSEVKGAGRRKNSAPASRNLRFP